MSSRPRILFVDAYDSFTNNIVAIFEKNFDVSITVIKVDAQIDCLVSFLEPFLAVILGPGPGHPGNPKDVGLFSRFWQLQDKHLLPILGICLGFQSLVLNFGGSVERLPQPRHGIVRTVRPVHGVDHNIIHGSVDTVQYHSLYAKIGNEKTNDGHLVALAWEHQADNSSTNQPTYDKNPPSILMAVRHHRKPFYGIQFHPESICSNEGAQQVVINWFSQVLASHGQRLYQPTLPQHSFRLRPDVRPPHSQLDASMRCQQASSTKNHRSGSLSIKNMEPSTTPCSPNVVSGITDFRPDPVISDWERQQAYYHKIIPLSTFTIPSIYSKLKLANDQIVLLDSEKHQRADVGKFSILGIVGADSLRFEYHAGTQRVSKIERDSTEVIDLRKRYDGDIFRFLKLFMEGNHVTQGPHEIPFWAGLIGCISYEACLETIDLDPPTSEPTCTDTKCPDISFIYIKRSIVISHATKEIYVQSTVPNDRNWVNSTAFVLKSTPPPTPIMHPALRLDSKIQSPNGTRYKQAVRTCKEHIHAGDSYELCLTNCATIRTDNRQNSWPLYLRLRQINAAPFAAHFRAGGLTLLSTSPERFLSWSRPTAMDSSDEMVSVCQFRPIKGTVPRRPKPDGRTISLAEAEKVLATPKERAENLMIVDLIRHDLHGVAGARNVRVPKLMVVEEYETLFQLVSVIEGTLRRPKPRGIDSDIHRDREEKEDLERSDSLGQIHPDRNGQHASVLSDKSGIDALAASLPPGSMTGAPKKRSCQLLQQLEGRARGIYSGVFGYLDVGGGGDFSVVIRSAVRWDGSSKLSTSGQATEQKLASDNSDDPGMKDADGHGDTWTIGAGGAITALSTEEGEYEEMMTKLKSTIRLFEDETTTYRTDG